MENELEIYWKEAVLAWEAPSRDLPGGTKKNHNKSLLE
jgi:hypothetical protein